MLPLSMSGNSISSADALPLKICQVQTGTYKLSSASTAICSLKRSIADKVGADGSVGTDYQLHSSCTEIAMDFQ